MRTSLAVALLALLAAFTLACAEDSSPAKGEESAVPEPSPKADTWFAPTLHGELVFGVELEAEITDGELFHAWDFALSEGAALELKTAPEANLDTVMYLYRRDSDTAAWGAYLERNDDHDGLIASRIAGSFDAGHYRVMVKGHKDLLRGTFLLSGSCEGSGCPEPVQSEPLSSQQAADIVRAFDNICPDTFCGGDLNYYGADVSCDFAHTTCTMTFDARSYFDEDALPLTALDGVSEADRVVAGAFSDGSGGSFVGTLVEMVDKGADGVWLRSTCALHGSYRAVGDVLAAPNRLSDPFYEQFLDCLSELEPRIFGL